MNLKLFISAVLEVNQQVLQRFSNSAEKTHHSGWWLDEPWLGRELVRRFGAAESQPGWRRQPHLYAVRAASVRWVTPLCPRRGAAHSVRLENHPPGDVTPAADKDSDLCIILSANASLPAHMRKPLRTSRLCLTTHSYSGCSELKSCTILELNQSYVSVHIK